MLRFWLRLLKFVALPDEPGVHGDRRAVVVRAGRVVLVDEVVVVLVDVSDEAGVHGDRGIEYLYLSLQQRNQIYPRGGLDLLFWGLDLLYGASPFFLVSLHCSFGVHRCSTSFRIVQPNKIVFYVS